jgi:hypothetical protein
MGSSKRDDTEPSVCLLQITFFSSFLIPQHDVDEVIANPADGYGGSLSILLWFSWPQLAFCIPLFTLFP